MKYLKKTTAVILYQGLQEMGNKGSTPVQTSDQTAMSPSEEHAHHPAWQRRMEELFNRLDRDKDGFVSMDDFMAQINKFEKDHVQSSSNGDVAPESIQNLRSCMQEICSAMGLTHGKKATKYEFIRDILVYAPREIEKKEKGEDPLIDKLNNAWYDAVGATQDVTREEWRIVTDAWQVEHTAAEKTFSTIDHENKGKISRKELNEKLFMFWFSREDEHSKQHFGEKGMFGEN
jgi:Ca2+-binding EF-hand superfamily protein